MNLNNHTHTRTTHTCVLKVRRVAHKQHVCVGGVCDPDEARLVLQRRRDAHADAVGVCGAVGVGATGRRPRHHLTHRHTGELHRVTTDTQRLSNVGNWEYWDHQQSKSNRNVTFL